MRETRILINASNLRKGGGIQVADSICGYLNRYPGVRFYVVLSSCLRETGNRIAGYGNVSVYYFDMSKKSLPLLLFGRCGFLDSLVEEKSVDAVLTVFGPSLWKPRVTHLCGFARSHCLPLKTPYIDSMPLKDKVLVALLRYMFNRGSNFYWTENETVSSLLSQTLRGKKVITVSNNCNQIFDEPQKWAADSLPAFDGTTVLTVTAYYPHKNLEIIPMVARELKRVHPRFKFRFVITIPDGLLRDVEDVRENILCIGPVDIARCPSLYAGSGVMFQPTLLECFSATYPEAMKMKVPIVTTNLDFIRSICHDAAEYYSPLDASQAAAAVYSVATDFSLREKLVERGSERLKDFLTAAQRADILIDSLLVQAGRKDALK